MTASDSQTRLAELSDLAKQVYDARVVPQFRLDDGGKFVAFDVDTADFEVDADELAAVDRLRARRPCARTWLSRTDDFSAHIWRGGSLKLLS